MGSVSVVVTAPDTDPLAPWVRVPLSLTDGAALVGEIATEIVWISVPPCPSLTVMSN